MYRVLIADDERIERIILYQMLDRNLNGRCQVFQAGNGREALEVYEREKVQIAILDIEMPGVNGIEAARTIREKDAGCSIIPYPAYLPSLSAPEFQAAYGRRRGSHPHK